MLIRNASSDIHCRDSDKFRTDTSFNLIARHRVADTNAHAWKILVAKREFFIMDPTLVIFTLIRTSSKL